MPVIKMVEGCLLPVFHEEKIPHNEPLCTLWGWDAGNGYHTLFVYPPYCLPVAGYLIASSFGFKILAVNELLNQSQIICPCTVHRFL